MLDDIISQSERIAVIPVVVPPPREPSRFRVEGHGTIVLVRPLAEVVEEWLVDHTDGQWFGGALAVEPRYVEALVEGLVEAGFEEAS